ncbi:hypothetical protein [Frigoriglobus tundricola]|uniref:Uncharacterized protein n=1 Tax=Frigoriglobus tundricola TaxID=2774151 RepID=A0A6M5YP15_9BACT|nr:hypothetical protein [Frigoriglobus tundricola]QJW95076.1 hypothetical protein FTUN_2602 [Frigoriglobus tundricola]
MAVLLTWALFVGWAAIGLAVLKLGRYRWSVAVLLLAPTVGFTALVVPTYILVRFGIPVRLLAWPVLAVLVATAAVTLWHTRPTRQRAAGSGRQARAFALVLIGAFALTGWPLVAYGFDWVAQGNDDMANYCLLATGYRDHGYARVPTLGDVAEGRDQTQAFVSFVLAEARPGSEVLLALTSAWSGCAVQQVFMPVIVALNMALVAAVSGLAVMGARRRAAGVLAGALLAVSAATTYGVIHQLIAQASGLALLCTSLALVTAPCRRLPAGLLLRRASVCGVVFAGQIVFYPEVTPLLAGGCVALGVRDLVRRRLDRRHLAHAGAAIAVMAALLPFYLYGCVSFLAQQTLHGNQSSEWMRAIFPHYLTPLGPALVTGVLPISGPESPLAQSAGIVTGMVILAAVVVPMLGGLRRGWNFAAVLATVAALGAYLYARDAAFGVFKIAMFAQPFLWAALAAWAVARRARWASALAIAVLVAIAGLNVRVQFWYVDQSCGREQRVALPAMTTLGTLTAFRADYARRVADGAVDRVLFASNNMVLLKLLAAEVRGTPTGYVGVNPFDSLIQDLPFVMTKSPRLKMHGGWREPLRALCESYDASFAAGGPTICDPDTGAPLHRVLNALPDQTDRARVLFVAGTGGVSILNRHRYPEDGPAVVCAPLAEMKNFAVFCDATGARQNFFGMAENHNISYNPIEADATFRKRTMAGVGHGMVLDVLNPSPRVRVLLSYTGSFKTDPTGRRVAPVEVVGDRRAAVGAVGSGAARLVSPPLAPQSLGGGHFLVLDLGPATPNPNRLVGVEKLWAADLPRDRRVLAAHVRDVSVLSEEEYAAFRPPQQVSKFPQDLLHPHLEYSGLFEEGWVGQEFKVRLTQPQAGQEAVIRGSIPRIGPDGAGFRTELTVLLDGTPVQTSPLGTGDFEVRVPGGAATGPRWIECRFSRAQILPAPDGRRAVALIGSIGFEPFDASRSRPPEVLSAFPADLSRPKLDASGIDLDGWVGTAGRARLWFAGPGRDIVVRGNVPLISGSFRTDITVVLDGAEVGQRVLTPGDFEVRVPVGTGPVGPRWVECRFSAVQPLPSPDTRATAAHLTCFGFEPKK